MNILDSDSTHWATVLNCANSDSNSFCLGTFCLRDGDRPDHKNANTVVTRRDHFNQLKNF